MNKFCRQPAAIVGRSKRVHYLKCWPIPFNDVRNKLKTFEFRKYDRDYKVGDYLVLMVYNPETGGYGNSMIVCQVMHLMTNEDWHDIPETFCIMSIRLRQNSQIFNAALEWRKHNGI